MTIPELRAMAIRRAQGDLVGITEDHCIAPDGWLEAMVRARMRRDSGSLEAR